VQHRRRRRRVEPGDRLERGERDLLGRRVGEHDVVELDDSGADGRLRAPGFCCTIGSRSSTSKTRSKLTSAVMTSTRTLDSAVSGPYSRVR
jgi:hypothetical protein